MRNIIFYLILVISFLLYGCKEKPQKNSTETPSTIKLDFKKEQKSIHDIDLIKDVDIINLDCDEVIIGEIDKVIKYDNIIYLMDKTKNKSIYLYNTKGEFLRSISNYGQGPEEYIQLTDMFIDPINSTLNIVSKSDKKLFIYNLSGDKLLKIEKTPKSFISMEKMNKSYLAYMGNYSEDFNQPYNLWLLNRNLEITNHFFKIDKMLESTTHSSFVPFSKYKDMYYYISPNEFYVYSISDKEVNTKYTFDVGDLKWPKDIDIDKLSEKELFMLNHNYISGFFNFQETEKHLIVYFIYQGQSLMGVYDKEKNEANIVTLDGYSEKYFFGFGHVIGFDEKTIYTLNEASHIYRMWKGKDEYNNFEEKYPTQIENLRKKFDTIREDGNPFLIMYSIK